MRAKALVCVLAAVLTVSASFGSFCARLWFKNITTGAENAGPVLVSPGDTVEIRFSFHKTDDKRPFKWSLLQIALDLANQTIIDDATADTWDTVVDRAFRKSAAFAFKNICQPSDGDMYDKGTDPTDRKKNKLVTHKGLYAIIGVAGTRPEAKDIDVVVFRFQVARQAVHGSELHWMFETRKTDSGLKTSILGNTSRSAQLTDNWLQVR